MLSEQLINALSSINHRFSAFLSFRQDIRFILTPATLTRYRPVGPLPLLPPVALRLPGLQVPSYHLLILKKHHPLIRLFAAGGQALGEVANM